MPNLTKCKDCGHTVSTRAKACPSCGVGNPANRTSWFTYLVAIFVLPAIGASIFVEVYKIRKESGLSGDTSVTTNVRAPLFVTDAQIQAAIAGSDDYELHKTTFTKAARYLLETRRCKQAELIEFGGFVKAQGDKKNKPFYFTYCGGIEVKNRLYIDAETGKVYK